MVLPCFDETDDGVPPFCKKDKRCPFNRENQYLAQNRWVLMFGNLGLPYCKYLGLRGSPIPPQSHTLDPFSSRQLIFAQPPMIPRIHLPP